MNIKPLCCLLLVGVLLCSYGNGHTIYIRPSADASCGFSEVSGDPCFTWAGISPTLVPPSTTLVFTSGYYTVQSSITVSSMTNFSMIGEPSARIGCTYRSSYGTAFTLSNINYVSISNLQFYDCVGNQLSNIDSFQLINSKLSHGPHRDTTSITMEYTNARVVNTMFYGNVAHIRMNSLSTLEVDASNFTSGYSDPRLYYPRGSVTHAYYNDGGSISNYLPLGTITIRDSRFFNNRAFAQFLNSNNHYSRGGAIYSLGEVTVINCLFYANNASQGGAIYSERKVTVINSNFTKNTGPGDYNNIGGAIYSLTDIVISNSTFHSNSARNGGATYSISVISTDNIFTNNTATESSDNFPNVGNGGAMYTLHNVTAVNTSFSNNTATGGTGGAVYTEANHTKVYFYGSSFSNNSAISCGVLNVDRLYATDVTMVNSTFSNNGAIGTTNGGGVACFGNGIVTIVSCVFSDNNAAASNGGVFNLKNSSIVIEECSFLGNAAQGSGGVVYTNEYQTNYTIRHSIFQRNSGNDGGVMYVQSNSNIEVETGTFIENHATGQGGVFYIRGGSLAIDTDSTFSGNTASSGDVISTCLSSIKLNDSAYGLEMQPDPQNPQYCSVYDEDVTSGRTPTTETHPKITTHAATTTSNTETTIPPEVTSSESAVSTSPGTPTTIATQGEVTTTPEVTSSESDISTALGTTTTIATQGEVTSSPTTFHSNTEDSSTTKNDGGTTVPTSSSMEITTKNLFKITTDQGRAADVERMSVTYTSLAIGLISLIVSVTVCVLMLLLFCKVRKKINSTSNGPYRTVERRVSFDDHEDEHSFAVDDSPSRLEESHLIPA